MKLIPDWSIAWRFLSVQAAVLLALLSGLQAEVLPLISPLFPDHVWPWVSGGLALAVVVLRLVAQDGLRLDREQLDLDQPGTLAEAQDPRARSHLTPSGQLEQGLGVAALLALVVILLLIGLAALALWKSAA